ncbi:MAG: GntR family transcriptional regulator, partial [Rhodococcus sp. (in: high G+C Gram-positive bacteria)]
MSVRPPLREQVYRSIRSDLMSGQIAPSERLGEERLAHLYGVSRTPVREALAKLESDGLVERDEHGLFPYRPHLDELGGLYELRLLLEVHGLRRVLEGEAPA